MDSKAKPATNIPVTAPDLKAIFKPADKNLLLFNLPYIIKKQFINSILIKYFDQL